MKIAIDQIVVSDEALRGVQRENPKYEELKASIRSMGLLNPICVRERTMPDGSKKFEIVEGLQRYSCFKDLGLNEIDANLRDFNEVESQFAQIIGNLMRVDMKPSEYAASLQRIVTSHPLMTMTQLAQKLGTSVPWLTDRLRLNRLNEAYKALVDSDQIKLTNAIQLAKLPLEEQGDWLTRAQTDQAIEFTAAVKQRLEQINKDNRAGREATKAEFAPVAISRKQSEIRDYQSNPNLVEALVRRHNITNPVDAAILVINWVLRLDPDGIAEQKAKHDDRLKKLEEKKAALAEERKNKAAENTVKVTATA